jgi:hypothetical protein
MTCFRYLLTNTLFVTGHWSSFVMFAISFPLSLFSLPQSCNRCYTVWVPLPQGHSGDSIILNRCKYDLVFLCAVTIAVKLGVKVVFIFSMSLILGKNSLVTVPFVVFSQSCCHFSMIISFSWCSISLFGILF